MTKLKVGVCGAYGKMGSLIVKNIFERDDMEIVCAVGSIKSEYMGRDIGKVLGIGDIGVRVTTHDRLNEVLKVTNPDVLVDFTTASTVISTAKIVASNGINLVIGTTGITTDQLDKMSEIIKNKKISAVISPNMAIGVNVFFILVTDAAKILQDYDIEIIETHHRHKKDAPSGTALRAGELIAKALDRDFEENAIFGRRGMVGERKTKEIGVHSVRAGDIVGDHTVLFAGQAERVEITHRVHSRQAFVEGTIKAIKFVCSKGKPSKIYSMQDVLELK